MSGLKKILLSGVLLATNWFGSGFAFAQDSGTVSQMQATMLLKQSGDFRIYELRSNAELRDNQPAEKRITFSEATNHATIRTGNVLFDGLYAMAIHEAIQNSVSQIKDNAYDKGIPVQLEAFQTGEFWTYVWTRDLAYSVNLALGGFDPERSVNSLLFKTSTLKSSVTGGLSNQIIQDTGSGGSYPVSTDRIIWALGASEALKYLAGTNQLAFLNRVYPILCDTIEQDRRLLFDASDGLYRGEQSFLDWREQTYPSWTKNDVLPIAMSKTLSVNAVNYFLLKTAAGYSGRLQQKEAEKRYDAWAENLKIAINLEFFDAEAGLYSTYLLSDGRHDIRVHRYDLLGESLAILFGLADEAKAEIILKKYPVGTYGPSVVWPQERTVPIYHNQAIWPFVTAYWIKAARRADNCAAVDAGIVSLMRLAGLNLSNMENYDFVSGKAQVKGQSLDGPVINSRRQLWSVAGYLSMVQDIVFGLETSWDGIRFQPYVTAELRNGTFATSETLELKKFRFRNSIHNVRIHLPATNSVTQGVCAIQRTELNGKKIQETFASVDSLQPVNQWDIYLEVPKQSGRADLNRVNVSYAGALFGPLQPVWDESFQNGIVPTNGHLVLHYRSDDASNVGFNIYRDGQLCAQGIRQTEWSDPHSHDYRTNIHYYAVEAVDIKSGNASHLSPPRCFQPAEMQQTILAREMQNKGGDLVSHHHFENWGKSADEILTRSFTVTRGGQYLVRVEFSNGSGPINTGITCAIKKLELVKTETQEVVGSGYVVMPQSGDWKRWDQSSPVSLNLDPVVYSIRLREDEYSRNMSYLKKNERYTAWAGGGEAGYNYVNVAAIHLSQLAQQTLELDRVAVQAKMSSDKN
jgi:hypothetical protein